MSWTRVWLPNEIARPNTEAPAMKGVILTPRLVSIVNAAVITMTMPSATRIMGARVSRRVALMGACPVSASCPDAPGSGPDTSAESRRRSTALSVEVLKFSAGNCCERPLRFNRFLSCELTEVQK